jgi:hypothetical protein
MSERPPHTVLRRAEARLWTGSSAHLLGGALDLLEAIARHAIARHVRGRMYARRA